MRLFWRFEDILLDYPKAMSVLAQSIAYLKLRTMIPGKVITQIPLELRERLINQEVFRESFEVEIETLKSEKEYRERIKDLLKEYFYTFDYTGV